MRRLSSIRKRDAVREKYGPTFGLFSRPFVPAPLCRICYRGREGYPILHFVFRADRFVSVSSGESLRALGGSRCVAFVTRPCLDQVRSIVKFDPMVIA